MLIKDKDFENGEQPKADTYDLIHCGLCEGHLSVIL